MKTCRDCKVEKPLSEFGINRRLKSGIANYCFECNRKKYNSRISRNIVYRNRYGITLEEVERMAESQNYKCKICKKDCKFLNNNLADSFVVDHCHTTGVVRGLLCGPCNRGIGMFNDNPDFLIAAAAYLS